MPTNQLRRRHGQGARRRPNVDKKDRAHRPANLTISRNPDGVVFAKFGTTQDPDMPAFKAA